MKKHIIILLSVLFVWEAGNAQITPSKDKVEDLLGQDLGKERNVITTATPFLMISPDSRAAGMGDLGVATSADANANHWNAAKLAFTDKNAGLSLSAAPWLRTLVPDVWHYYLAGYGKIGKRSVLSGSLRYFTLGDIQFTDGQGEPLGNYEPNELAVDGAFATQLSKNFSMAVALRFIYSNLATGQIGSTGAEIKAGVAGAGDVSMFYKNKTKIGGMPFKFNIGANISNMGNKISYTNNSERDFIPTNLRIGTFWTTDIDSHNAIGFGVDLNKLLVPTPTWKIDTTNGQERLYKELSTDPVLVGMGKSFYDAPGGFSEEMKEINVSVGMEYWYDKQFALRAGYFWESEIKGARQFLTFGAGLKYQVFQIDAAYLQPLARRHPLQNTIRFSLLFDIEAFNKQNASTSN